MDKGKRRYFIFLWPMGSVSRIFFGDGDPK